LSSRGDALAFILGLPTAALLRGRTSTLKKRTDLNQPLQKLEQLEHAIEETLAEAIPPKSC